MSEQKPADPVTADKSKPRNVILREMRDVQGSNGNWNYNPYMHGMYNGMEYALALIEDRDPDFKDAPEKWLSDKEVKIELATTN